MATPPVLLPGKFHGQRSLLGYTPRCCKESARMTKHTHLFSHLKIFPTFPLSPPVPLHIQLQPSKILLDALPTLQNTHTFRSLNVPPGQ